MFLGQASVKAWLSLGHGQAMAEIRIAGGDLKFQAFYRIWRRKIQLFFVILQNPSAVLAPTLCGYGFAETLFSLHRCRVLDTPLRGYRLVVVLPKHFDKIPVKCPTILVSRALSLSK
jgi:hypothetical protein